jgi:hypothetical protein
MSRTARHTMRDSKYEQVVASMFQRIDGDHRRIQQMIDIRDRYNGDWVVPIPDLEGEDEMPAPVPNLLADAIDQTSMRAGSVMPFIEVPAVTSSVGRTTDTSRRYAATRRRFLYSTWDYSALDLLLLRGFRHLVGYGSNALTVVPDFEDQRARIQTRDPLTAYPEPREPDDIRPPRNVAYVYARSRAWIKAQYGHVDGVTDLLNSYLLPSGEDSWMLFEWVDDEEIILGILGPKHRDDYRAGYTQGEHPALNMPLRRWPNRAGICTSYVPYRVTLNRVMAQVAASLKATDLWAKLMTLDVVAAERAVFSDKYALGAEGRTPAIISGDGHWQDGRTGEINILQDVRGVGALNDGPGPAAQPIIDRLERKIRVDSGAIPQFSGETPGSLRTGRAIDALSSFAIDPRIQELHTIMKYALKAVNEQVMAVTEGYWPSKKYVVFSGWPVDKGLVQVEPYKHFETEDGGRHNAVSYPFPGADLSQTNVAVGQLVGAGLMSKKSGRIKHPFIEDHEAEERSIAFERQQDAALVGFSQQTAAGQVTLADAARVAQKMREGIDPLEAIVEAEQEAQERAQEQMAQAQQAAQEGGAPPAPPAGLQPASPVEQARAQQAAGSMVSAIPPPTTSQDRLRALFSNLRARA